MNSILDEVLTYVDYQNIFDHVEVKKDYAVEMMVYCDRPQMIQVILNLVTNAADAMGGRGTLRLRTRHEVNRNLVSVEDTGAGIDPKHLKKIFDPFFTTKEAGKGTGLGLPIVQRIVQQHGGSIRVRSEPGNTVFEVALPVPRPGAGPAAQTFAERAKLKEE
jgi:signal transduction histidine kinase